MKFIVSEILLFSDIRVSFLNSLPLDKKIKASSTIEAIKRVNSERAKLFGKTGKANKIKFDSLTLSSRKLVLELESYII